MSEKAEETAMGLPCSFSLEIQAGLLSAWMREESPMSIPALTKGALATPSAQTSRKKEISCDDTDEANEAA